MINRRAEARNQTKQTNTIKKGPSAVAIDGSDGSNGSDWI